MTDEVFFTSFFKCSHNTGYVQIKTSITINSGVTVILPYDNNGAAEGGVGSNTIGTDGTIVATLTTADNSLRKEGTYCSTVVTVNANCNVFVNGTLVISGEISGSSGNKKYAGQTAGYFAKLILKDNAYVGVSGILHVPGLIDDESTSTTPAIVNVSSGGTLFEPFVVRDFKGGTVMSAIYTDMDSYQYSPFNQFQFINITTRVVINYGGSMKAYANLHASDKQNTTIGNMVGSNNSSVIQLSPGARLEAKYDVTTDILDLHFYGGASTNALVLETIVTVSSDSFVFPVSWMFHITFDRTDYQKQNDEIANYNLNQRFKLMPGSEMTINEGARVRVNSLIVYGAFTDGGVTYPNFTDEGSNLPGQYPSKYPDTSTAKKGQSIPEAKLTVNGTLIAVLLGGKVYTTNTSGSAVVQATSYISVTSYEPKATKDITILGYTIGKSISERFTITLPLTLYSADGTLLNNTTTLYPGIQYYTNGGTWQVPPYFALIAGEGYDVVVAGGKHLKLDDEGNPIIENGEFVFDTAEYRSADYRNPETGLVTRGVYLLTTQPGTEVTYILQNRYVIPSGMETTYNSSFENSIQGERTVTKTIIAPLEVKYVPEISISNGVEATQKAALSDVNNDGIYELKIELTTSGSCEFEGFLWWGEYVHTLPSKFKVNVNDETITIKNEDGTETVETVYEKCVVDSRCDEHSETNDANVLTYTYSSIVYSSEGSIVINVVQDN